MLLRARGGALERFLRSKIHQGAFQAQGSAAVLKPVPLGKRAQQPAPPFQTPDLFADLDRAEDALPLKFFLACLLAPAGGCEAGPS